jgi:hypothetical protein
VSASIDASIKKEDGAAWVGLLQLLLIVTLVAFGFQRIRCYAVDEMV